MPKIQKNKIEQCTKIFIYRDLKRGSDDSWRLNNAMQEKFTLSPNQNN